MQDNGEKISKDIKNYIFEEGISSKGENRGLGLSLVKNRIEIYGGKIDIEEFTDNKIFKVIISKGESIND